jgi:small-conductance mechanosensitive channel
MTTNSAEEPDTLDPAEKDRRRNAWILLFTHAVAFVVLLIGFLLRLRYVEAEGVGLDWIAVVLAIAGTIIFIVALALLLVSRRRAALRRALVKNGVHGPMVLAYWSRVSNPPFLNDDVTGPRGRGLEVAVTTGTGGIHIQALARRSLVDFGLIPWSHLEAIEAGKKMVGVGVPAKGGALRIVLTQRTPPYTERLEFFPTGQAAAEAAQALRTRRPSA